MGTAVDGAQCFGPLMKNEKGIQQVEGEKGRWQGDSAELERARSALVDAEAELAREQAAVNAFRMHCRLKLDELVDLLQELRSERESLLVRLELLHQGVDLSYWEDDDPLSQKIWSEETAEEEELLLPTDTPGDKAAEKRLYRELARRFHPDLAISVSERSHRTTMMAAVNIAYAEGDSEALYDLAGELSAEETASLAQISDLGARRSRQAINKMRRLESKAKRHLAALRRENTARLWRRAQQLDEHDEDGWGVIRRELLSLISRRQDEIVSLRRRLDTLETPDQAE